MKRRQRISLFLTATILLSVMAAAFSTAPESQVRQDQPLAFVAGAAQPGSSFVEFNHSHRVAISIDSRALISATTCTPLALIREISFIQYAWYSQNQDVQVPTPRIFLHKRSLLI